MADPRQTIRNELSELVLEGTLIAAKELSGSVKEGRETLKAALGDVGARAKGAPRKRNRAKGGDDAVAQRHTAMIERVMKQQFAPAYQRWYSAALPVVEQLLPDRHDEFRELYRLDRRPKELDPATYSISDYINGIVITRGWGTEPEFDTATVALTRMQGQTNILASAEGRLDSALADIRGLLEATLLDDELDVARELHKNKYFRAGGVVAGVVLERHLNRVVANHQITFRKKAQIGNLNDALKDAGIYGVVQWRQIQRLGDIRNLCGHAGERDPSGDEVLDLIDGVATVVKSIF